WSFTVAFAAVDVALEAQWAQSGLVAVNLGVLLAELHESDRVAHRRHQSLCPAVARDARELELSPSLQLFDSCNREHATHARGGQIGIAEEPGAVHQDELL